MEVSIITLTLITFMINPINKDNLIKSPTMKEKSWLAGFIDGEGYIGITRQRKKRK